MPTVGIITRTHNRPELLKRAVASVGSQSFDDYVHLIVNDRGEPQPVWSIVDALPESQRQRTEIIQLEETPLGREGVVNPGLSRAHELHTDFCVVLDDDDSWEPDFLEATTQCLEENPQFVAVATQSNVIYERVDTCGIQEEKRELLAADKTLVTLEDTLVENYVPPVALLFRTALLEKLHGWDASLPVLADWDFMLRLLLEGKVFYLLRPLANWHHRLEATGDLGNSIVVEANNHEVYHTLIRDNYLRMLGEKNQPLGQKLALPLLLAHHQRLIQEELQDFHKSEALHSEQIKTHLHLQIYELEKQIKDLSEQVSTLTQMLFAVNARLDSRFFSRLRRFFKKKA
ncbi:glycosyltransferase family 2 protein [Mobiluncus mulieris]|uniref:glycosyltransferase n=1 Tax=Mobiluncus mulieris TaxID=2052 RepID=UPI0014700B05|nr:glycosyltransferase family 2 protein [Mobiluncus mulieris]